MSAPSDTRWSMTAEQAREKGLTEAASEWVRKHGLDPQRVTHAAVSGRFLEATVLVPLVAEPPEVSR